MGSCNYNLFQDMYEVMETQLTAIATQLEDLDLSLKIDELDLDLDNLETQLKIANKLKLLEAIGTDIMTEQEQLAAYTAIKAELFPAQQGN